uniref:Tetraspanin n=1 Tax=Anopheles albimanus TaxID=7167 RepID=A0A182FV19_ANOAL
MAMHQTHGVTFHVFASPTRVVQDDDDDDDDADVDRHWSLDEFHFAEAGPEGLETLDVPFIVGAGLFAFTIFIRAEPGFDEWIAILDVYQYYIGIYILIGAGALVMIFSFLGCCSALMEHSSALYLADTLTPQDNRLADRK